MTDEKTKKAHRALLLRYGKQFLKNISTLGKTAYSVVTEPFTNKILKKHNKVIKTRNDEQEEMEKDREETIKKRYSYSTTTK